MRLTSLRKFNACLTAVAVLAWAGCDDDEPAGNGGRDTGGDASGDGGVDTGVDTNPDTGVDTNPDTGTDTETDTPDDTTEDTADGGDISEEADTTGPVISNLTYVPSGSTLALEFSFETDEAATASVVFTGDDDHELTFAEDALVTDFSFTVLGLHPDVVYAIEITATDAADNDTVDTTGEYTTEPLPEDFPEFDLVTSDAEGMEPGVTLIDIIRWVPGGDTTYGLIFGVDSAGNVVWYYQTDHRALDPQRLSNGNLIYLRGDEGAVEIDMMGNIVHEWQAANLLEEGELREGATAVDIDTLHHEIHELPNGNFLTLSTEMVSIPVTEPDGGGLYCASYADLVEANDDPVDVIGDVAVEFDPETGDVVSEWSVFDMAELDPCRRITHDFAGGFWNGVYGSTAPSGTTRDWTHGNAIILDEEDNTVIMSLRHSDWLVGFQYADDDSGDSGDVLWLLGAEGDLGDEPTDGEWQWHQHAPQWLGEDRMLVFDNGNLRPGTNFVPDDDGGDADMPYSRAVEYELNTTDGEVTQVWEWTDSEENLYAPFVGDVDLQPNGNVLINFGGLVTATTDAATPDVIQAATNRKWVRIVEVTRPDAAEGEVVFDLRIGEDAALSDTYAGFSTYRAERLESLYPPAE